MYDLIILDVMMPGMDGLELCRYIRSTSSTPIIFISARDTVHDKVLGLASGADDYLGKPFHPDEVIARVSAALRRTSRPILEIEAITTPDLVLDTLNHRATLLRNGSVVPLTPTEWRILHYLASCPGLTLTRDVLILTLWGNNHEGADNLLEVNIRRLRHKIEDKPRKPKLIITVRGIGYKYQPSDRAQTRIPDVG